MTKKQARVVARERARGWIMLRYCFPLIAAGLILCILFVPCLQYTNNQSGTEDPISTLRLMKNSWDQVRNYLFGGGQQTNGNIQFSRTVLILLILFWILFAIGVAVAIWALFAHTRYAEDGEEQTGRLWFLTLIPNRVVLCVLSALIFPIAFFPRIVILLYRSIYVAVELKVFGIDPALLAVLLLIAMSVLSAVCVRPEKRYGLDLFRKPRESRESEPMPEPKEEIPTEPSGMNPPQRGTETARRREAERIAELLRVKEEAHQDEKQED